MCKAFGLRKYSRVPGVSRRSSRYDFSMAAPSTAVPANAAFSSSVSGTRQIPSTGSNGNFRPNNGANSIKCVAIVSHSISNNESSTVAAHVTESQTEVCPTVAGEATTSSIPTSAETIATATKDSKTNNGLLLKDNSEDDDPEQIVVTTCLIEKFAEKQNAIFV